MADEKLNTGPAENISPEAAEPITTPEQAAASEPQQEQTGPSIPESGDVVVSFDKINELMAEKRQNARAEVEKSETPDAGEHIYKLDQGHNSRWGCLPHLRMCLIGVPHQKQKQPVTGCTKQDFFTVHNV